MTASRSIRVILLMAGIILAAAQSSSEPTPAIKLTLDLSTPPATPTPATTRRRRQQGNGGAAPQPPTHLVPGNRRSSVTGTGSFRLAIATAVSVSASRVRLTGWEQDLNEIVADFYFTASSASGEPTSTELATKLQYELFNKNSQVYADTLYPMHITKSVFATLPNPTANPGSTSATTASSSSGGGTPAPATTPSPPAAASSSSSSSNNNAASTPDPATPMPPEVVASTPESSSSSGGNVTVVETPVPETPVPPPPTPAPPTPQPPPTPVPTPVPTPLAPREVINGSGILFSEDLEGEAEQTSTIWIVVMVCIGLLTLIGIAVCLIKCCGREKKEERRVYGEHIK